MIGHILRNYKILEKIGEGGMGAVYKAQHLSLNRTVSIKSLNKNFFSNNEIIHRFKNEAIILSNLQHPNIVTLYDYVEDENGYYLIMEYFEGMTLEYYIRNVIHAIPETQAILIFEQLLSGFAYAHGQGIIHRDIKPSNILINSKLKVKILDFGIAKMKEGNLQTQLGTRIGTVLYMSPEQIQGHSIDHRTDIYSLGVVLWEMVTGKCPFDANSQSEFEISNEIVHKPLPHPKTIQKNCTDKIYQIIQKCTAKNPNQRYKNCEEIRMDTLFHYPELFQKSAPTKKIIRDDTYVIEEKPFPWKSLLAILLILILSVASYFLFFFQNYSEKEIKDRIVQFYDKMNQHDISIKDLVEPNLRPDFTLERLRNAGKNEVDTSSFKITKIDDGYKVNFLRKNLSKNQEIIKNTTFYLRKNNLKIYLTRSEDIKNSTPKNQNPQTQNLESEITHFIQSFYQYADAQNIDELVKCYDEKVEKWFLENYPVTNDYIKKNASNYVQKVQKEKTETWEYQIKDLGNAHYEVQFKIDYSYEPKPKGLQRVKRKGVIGDVIMKIRKVNEEFKVYYLELKNQKEY